MFDSLGNAQDAIAYLLARIEKDPQTDCWLWKLSVGNHGYGQCGWNGRMTTAHRLSHCIFKGDPGSLFVLHKCRNRRCCNPEHLYAGTQLDNFHDMLKDGTHVPPPKLKGEEVGNAALTDQEASEIKQSLLNGTSAVKLARKYDVSPVTIGNIKKNKHYSHVEPFLPEHTKTVRGSVTKRQIAEVQARLSSGERNRAIAQDMNLNESTVSRIKLGRIKGD